MEGYGPDQRALFEESAAALYEEAVDDDGLADDDARLKPGGELRGRLRPAGLPRPPIHDQEAGLHRPVDPSAVQSRVVAPMSQQGAELISESAAWANTFGTLAHAWRRSPAASRGPFTELQGQAIGAFIESVVADAESELLTAQPQTGRNDPKGLAIAAQRDAAAVERGVKMRTLYQHSARRSAITHKYVAAVTKAGAEVRTLDEFFNRLIVVDRRVAVIPGKTGALAVREPMVVDYLVDVFERHWERARPFANRESTHVARGRSRAARDDDPDADRGPRRPEQRQAPRRQPAHLRRLRRRPQGGVRRRDPLPARLRDGPARGLGPGGRGRRGPGARRAGLSPPGGTAPRSTPKLPRGQRT